MIKDSCSIHQMSTYIIYFINLFSNFIPHLCILGFIVSFDMPIPKKYDVQCGSEMRSGSTDFLGAVFLCWLWP